IIWTRDRNGNRIDYTYEPGPYNKRLIQITDSIGRIVHIDYDVSEPDPYGRCTKITFKGFSGQDRIIRISRDADLSHLLRTTQPGDPTTPINIVYDDPNDNIFIYSG